MADAETTPPPPSRKGLDRVLIGAIAVMTSLLVGGVLVVLGTIAVRVANRGGAPASAAAVSLPVEGSIRSLSLEGDRIALVVQTPRGEVVLIYDLALGREVGRLTLAPSGR